MIFDANMPLDFDENGMKFVDLLDGILDGNKVIYRSKEKLKTMIEEAGLPLDQADSLIKKVEDCGAIKHTAAPGYLEVDWISIKSLKHAIAERTCPACRKQTLQIRQIQVKCCKNCGETIEAEPN